MRRGLLSLGIALTLSTLALAVLADASAAGSDGSRSVSGAYAVSDVGATTCAPVGASTFMFRCETTGLVSQYTGDLVGTAVADFTSLINCATGRETGHGSETFTGSMGAVSGTLSWTDVFSADIDCTTFFPFNLDINSVAVKGSGGFAGTQGKLTFTDTTYNGTLH